ncbi:MAG: transporter [Lentisphaeria bacterium]|nr:transporter [Lentisphaeria bacterium]
MLKILHILIIIISYSMIYAQDQRLSNHSDKQKSGEADQKELAKKLANPVADLMSFPIQANYDEKIGPEGKTERLTVNFQPVIPIHLNENWNLITRTIVPLIYLNDFPVDGENKDGIGDILQSFFFSPTEKTENGWILGAGPIFSYDTASSDELGSGKWAAGPTAVALKQDGPWTFGGLGWHINSFAGDSDREYVALSYMQPFVNYITETHTSFMLNTESSYDWHDSEWSVPINFEIKQMMKIGKQIFQLGVGARYWAKSPEDGPEDWGARFSLTYIVPL